VAGLSGAVRYLLSRAKGRGSVAGQRSVGYTFGLSGPARTVHTLPPRQTFLEEAPVMRQSFWMRSAATGARLGLALVSLVGGSGLLVSPAAVLVATAAPPAQSATVTIYDDRLDPGQLSLEVSSAVNLDVVNQTGVDCTFYIEGYVSDIQVPAGGNAGTSFEIPSLPPRPDTIADATTEGPSDSGSVAVPMGCRGVAAQQGQAVVQQQPGT
jgi:hypothetical protein